MGEVGLWEQTTRVPLIFATPEGVVKAEYCDEPVSLLDLYPTLSALCGLSLMEKMDGENLMPPLRDPNQPTARSVVSTQGRMNHAVRSAEWRYIRYADGSEEL